MGVGNFCRAHYSVTELSAPYLTVGAASLPFARNHSRNVWAAR